VEQEEVQIRIRCSEPLRRGFKSLCVSKGLTYSEMLKALMDVYEDVQRRGVRFG
jgi:hypothetical protein